MKLTYLFIIGLMLAFAMPLVLAEVTSDVSECSKNKDCWDKYQSCYYTCHGDICGQIQTLVAETYPDCTLTDTITDAEIDLNDNATVSTGEIIGNQIQTWFTFNQEKKAELELKLARLRLIQAKVAAQNGDDESMAKAIEAHNKLIERVKERVNAMDGASDEKGVKDSATKLVGLERAVQVHEARIERLNTLLANENLTAEQKAKIQARITNAEEATAKLTEVQSAKMEQVKTRLMAIANMSEEEADESVEELTEKIQERVQERLADNSGNTEEVQTQTQTESAGESTEVQTETSTQTQASSGAQTQAGKA